MQRMGWKRSTGKRKTTEEAPEASEKGGDGVDKSGSLGNREADRFRIDLPWPFIFLKKKLI